MRAMRQSPLFKPAFALPLLALFLSASSLTGLTGCEEPPGIPLPPIEPPEQVSQPRRYVVPFIGSGGFGFRHGSSFVGASAPHGLAKVGPDTRGPWGTVNFLHYSGYWYGDDTIQGFSQMHLHGTGATDYGVLTVMPLDDFAPDRTKPEVYGSRMRKPTETASPGYYAVTLERGEIRSEMTATTHAAYHRYSFAKAVPRKSLLIDLGHALDSGEVSRAEIKLDPDQRTLRGQLRSLGGMSRGYGGYEVYFVIRSRTPWTGQEVWSEGNAPAAGTQALGKGVGVVLFFDGAPSGSEPAGPPIELQIGLSLVSLAGAEKNLATELPEWDFDKAREKTASAWDRLLNTLKISGGTEAERRMFFSSLYRSFLMPSQHSDTDGQYLGMDGKAHAADGFRYVSDLSLWDTYRTLHPLYSLIAPAAALDSVRSLLAMAQARGSFPKWPLAGGDSGSMIGAPAELVVADAYLKGHTAFDAEAAYQILRAAAMDPVAPMGGRGGRNHVEDYMRYGYVPSATGGSVSLTTEYARGDAALAALAGALGHKQDADKLAERARSFRALYDTKVGFLRGRAADGTFSWRAYDPTKYSEEYVEANGWQALWMNDHDTPAMIEMLGGSEAFVSKLSEMMEGTRKQWEAEDQTAPTAGATPPDYHWAGNENEIHAPYLFALAGKPELTQSWVRWVMKTQFTDTPAGLPGNDDGGTMAAWYLFSAMGLYPIVGTDLYVLSAPLFPRIEVAVQGGTFLIDAPDASADRYLVREITLNGTKLTSPVIKHSELRAGHMLRFTLAKVPN